MMGSVVLRRTILVILSTCYTSGLELTDLYPYGTQHGDAISIGSGLYRPTPLLAPIDNLVIFSPAGLTAARYRIYRDGSLVLENDGGNWISVNLLRTLTGHFLNTKIYGRITANPVLVKRAMDQINEGFPNTFCSTSPPTQLIIATWIDYLKDNSNPGSNFQLIVVSTGCNTFGIALYLDVNITSATTGIGSNIDGNSVPPDPSFFPFGTTVMDAPTMMLNSTIPGTYIFPLNDIPPVPCTVYKAKFLKMACEAIRRINGEKLPAPCRN